MVNRIHTDALRSEIATLREMLRRTSGRDKLGAMSLTQRLAKLEKQLALEAGATRNIASVALVFEGGPVRGSSAVDADFAGRALQEYQELVAKQMAFSDLGGLAQRGPLPIEQQRRARLNITGLVHGSFGFVLEEDNAAQAQMFESATMIAVSNITDIIEGVSSVDSRWFDENLQDLDARIFYTVRSFVSLLHRNGAALKILEEKRETKIGYSSVNRAFDRVSQTDVEQIDEEIQGELLGLVPIQRRFDFRRADTGEFVSGTVAITLSADYLERIERDELIAGRSWRAVVRTKTVRRADGRKPTITRILFDLLQAEE